MMSLVYVSQSSIEARDRRRVLDDILSVSIDRNSNLGITGLLIASPGYFVHMLEGPIPGIAAVMSSILADPRHTAVRIVRQSRVGQAITPCWRMARFDTENFGFTIIDPLLMAAHAGNTGDAVRRVDRLLEVALCSEHAKYPMSTMGSTFQRR